MNSNTNEFLDVGGNVRPTMSYAGQYIVRIQYVGLNKIGAIKVIRDAYGLTLKAAKELVEWPGGWLTTKEVLSLLKTLYMSYGNSEYCEENWLIMIERPEPVNMLGGSYS